MGECGEGVNQPLPSWSMNDDSYIVMEAAGVKAYYRRNGYSWKRFCMTYFNFNGEKCSSSTKLLFNSKLSKHALDTLSDGAMKARMRRVTTYRIYYVDKEATDVKLFELML